MAYGLPQLRRADPSADQYFYARSHADRDLDFYPDAHFGLYYRDADEYRDQHRHEHGHEYRYCHGYSDTHSDANLYTDALGVVDKSLGCGLFFGCN